MTFILSCRTVICALLYDVNYHDSRSFIRLDKLDGSIILQHSLILHLLTDDTLLFFHEKPQRF